MAVEVQDPIAAITRARDAIDHIRESRNKRRAGVVRPREVPVLFDGEVARRAVRERQDRIRRALTDAVG